MSVIYSNDPFSFPPSPAAPQKVEIKDATDFQSSEGSQIQSAFAQIRSIKKTLDLGDDATQGFSDAYNDLDVADKKISRFKRKRPSEEDMGPKKRVAPTQEVASVAKNIFDPNSASRENIDIEELERRYNNPYTPKSVPAPPQKALRKQLRGETLSSFKLAHANAINGTFQYGGQTVTIKLIARGSFRDVYEITSQEPIIFGISNDKLVVKIFNQKIIAFSDSKLTSMMANTLKYHMEAKEFVDVATIHNCDTASEDGCIIQERVVDPFDILNSSHLMQARKFYQAALKNRTVRFDFHPDNLRVTDKGDMKGIDSPEEEEDLFLANLEALCRLYVQKAQATEQEARTFLATFTKGFERDGYKRDWDIEIISAIFLNFNALPDMSVDSEEDL